MKHELRSLLQPRITKDKNLPEFLILSADCAEVEEKMPSITIKCHMKADCWGAGVVSRWQEMQAFKGGCSVQY